MLESSTGGVVEKLGRWIYGDRTQLGPISEEANALRHIASGFHLVAFDSLSLRTIRYVNGTGNPAEIEQRQFWLDFRAARHIVWFQSKTQESPQWHKRPQNRN